METVPDRDSRGAKGAWSSWRRWTVLLGALILFAGVFDRLERLVTSEEPSSARIASDPADPPAPIRPEIARLDDDGVRVALDGGYRITIHLDDETQVDRLIACIEEGLASSSALTEGEAGQPPASDGMIARHVRSQQVWDEVNRIQNACMMDLIDVPVPLPSGP